MPEFWCGVDWITEKNLELEAQHEEAAAQARRQHAAAGPAAPTHKRGTAPKQRGSVVTINPDLRVKPNPGYREWREELRRNCGI